MNHNSQFDGRARRVAKLCCQRTVSGRSEDVQGVWMAERRGVRSYGMKERCERTAGLGKAGLWTLDGQSADRGRTAAKAAATASCELDLIALARKALAHC